MGDIAQSSYPNRFADAVATTVAVSLDLERLRERVVTQAETLVARGLFRRARRIVIAGSGDSLFAAIAALPALRRWTGLAIEAMGALQLARYEAPLLGEGDLVVAISNSGGSARTRESVLLACDAGVPTLGVTGSAEGPLARLVQHLLVRQVQPLDALPRHWGRVFLNMSEYLATLHALYELALVIGTAAGRLSSAAAADWRNELGHGTTALPDVAARLEPAVATLAAELAGASAIWALGAGPNRSTAAYCAAKFQEQIPLVGIHQDLEEWAHLEYFLTLELGSRSVVAILAPPGNAFDRAGELVSGIAGAGGRAIVITERAAPAFAAAATLLPIGNGFPELVTPLVYHLPVQLPVLHLARLKGAPHIPLRRRDNYELIRGGAVRQ